jgi:outer membrane protein OmpA-like peptidoglycan-associated protein
MKNILPACCFLLTALTGYGQPSDTFQVYFPLNDPKISKQAGDMIDKMIFNDMLVHGQKLILLGYADYLGDNVYNDALSDARAGNIQDYLVSYGFDKKDVKLCIGKGKINRAPVSGKDGIAEDRKVQIIIDREPHTDPHTNPYTPKKDSTFLTTSSLTVDATYPLNILFVNSSSVIVPKSAPVLKTLLDFMVKNPTVRIQIEGHVCCMNMFHNGDGVDTATNQPLSWTRARAIYTFLVQHGISRNRLEYKGFAGTVPLVYPEKTPEDQDKNRRVEIRILSK